MNVNYEPQQHVDALATEPRSVTEELRIGAHEVGHTILRWYFGRGDSIDQVTIERRNTEDGRTVNGSVRGPEGNLDDDVDVFNRLIELVAGSVAEEVFLGEGRGLKGSDKRKAHLRASYLAESNRAVKLLLQAAKAEAEEILRRYSLIFDRLIIALHERRTIPGADIVGLIEREVARFGLPPA